MIFLLIKCLLVRKIIVYMIQRRRRYRFPRGEAAPVRTLGLKRNAGENLMVFALYQASCYVLDFAVPLPSRLSAAHLKIKV
jgi:hypothetical protein